MKNKYRICVIGLLFSVIFCSKESLSQVQYENNETLTSYINVYHNLSLNEWYGEKLVGFILKNLDSMGTANWESEIITSFEKYNQDAGPWTYFIKVNLPKFVISNSKELWCSALVTNTNNQTDTMRINYGGVKLSNITLKLVSKPEGAEAFLIPNRIWKDKIEKSNWQKNETILENFRVNAQKTNVDAAIDETVYVVLFKFNNLFKKRIHYTKPASIEKHQKVSVTF